MKNILLLTGLFVFAVFSSHASSQAKFSVVANTPTTITVPANRHALVQYKVTNNTLITRTLTMVPVPGATQRTDDSSQCANPFVLASGQSCNLTLFVDGSQLTSPFFGGPVVCKTKGSSNTPDSFLCSQPESAMILSITPAPAVTTAVDKLYVSNWDGNSISLCYLNAGALAFCQVSAVSNTFLNPEALAISNNVLFVANIGGGISSCLIDPVSGELSSCQNAVPAANAPVYAPTGIAIQGGQAFIANSGPEQFHQGVTVCNISGASLTSCGFFVGSATFSVPSDLAITNNTVYVTNFNSQNVQTTYCTVAATLCSAGEGTISGTGNLLNEPEGITFAIVNGINYAYFTNHGSSTVTFCRVASATSFTGCALTGGSFSGFGNLAILNSPLKAYIPSGLKSIAVCDVSSVDGSLSNCVNSTEVNFNNPSGLIINYTSV